MTNYYYTGTDYSTMVPWHWEFWFHLMVPWNFHNWVWMVLLFLWLWVRYNEKYCFRGPGFVENL